MLLKHCQPILTCKLKTTDGVNRYGRNFWVALLNEFSRFSFFAYPLLNQSLTHMYFSELGWANFEVFKSVIFNTYVISLKENVRNLIVTVFNKNFVKPA